VCEGRKGYWSCYRKPWWGGSLLLRAMEFGRNLWIICYTIYIRFCTYMSYMYSHNWVLSSHTLHAWKSVAYDDINTLKYTLPLCYENARVSEMIRSNLKNFAIILSLGIILTEQEEAYLFQQFEVLINLITYRNVWHL
jgi:hypothetical protein